MLDRLREEKAIEAKGASGGGTTQAVFDLSSGSFGGGSTAESQASTDGGPATETVTDRIAEQFGEDAEEGLAALTDLDVNETPPVELMAKVQQWQDELDGE